MTLIEDLMAASALTNFAKRAKENGSKSISSASKSTLYSVGARFPIQLMKLLNCGKHDDIISWTPDNRCFIVYNPHQLVREVLPLYFEKNLKYSSFTRKLHRWGFLKISSNTFFHGRFRRGDFAGASTISCKKGQDIHGFDKFGGFSKLNPYCPGESSKVHQFQTKEALASQINKRIPLPWNLPSGFTTSQRRSHFPPEDCIAPANEFPTRWSSIPDLLETKLNERVQYFNPMKPLIYPRTHVTLSPSRCHFPSTSFQPTRNIDFRNDQAKAFDNPFISIRCMTTEEFMLHFERKRNQHKIILNDAWNAIKGNHRLGPTHVFAPSAIHNSSLR